MVTLPRFDHNGQSRNRQMYHQMVVLGWESFPQTTLPETNSSPLKIDPWKFGDSHWKPPFSGAMLVLGSVTLNSGLGFCWSLKLWIFWMSGRQWNIQRRKGALRKTWEALKIVIHMITTSYTLQNSSRPAHTHTHLYNPLPFHQKIYIDIQLSSHSTKLYNFLIL